MVALTATRLSRESKATLERAKDILDLLKVQIKNEDNKYIFLEKDEDVDLIEDIASYCIYILDNNICTSESEI